MNTKVVGIGMSGGVDSSVSAYLLKEEGYKVIGITMKLIDGEKTESSIQDAKMVCERLGIEHHVLDLREEFKKIVINNFIETYKNGRTPNPCCVCNKFFKFGLFYEEAKKLGCNYIATGHYADIRDGKLYRAKVLEKDQSYFLYGINKEVLKNVLMPLKKYASKEEVREIARKHALGVESRKDSQEVCFVPNDDYKAFLTLNSSINSEPGDICLETGEIIGKHSGLVNYTIGQRKGLNISYSEPLYVIKIDTQHNKLIVGPNTSLFKNKLLASNVNLLVDDSAFKESVYCKVRSRGNLKKCEVKFLSDGMMEVNILEGERAITPGQAVVFYDKDDCCLGGGVIEQVL